MGDSDADSDKPLLSGARSILHHGLLTRAAGALLSLEFDSPVDSVLYLPTREVGGKFRLVCQHVTQRQYSRNLALLADSCPRTQSYRVRVLVTKSVCAHLGRESGVITTVRDKHARSLMKLSRINEQLWWLPLFFPARIKYWPYICPLHCKCR